MEILIQNHSRRKIMNDAELKELTKNALQSLVSEEKFENPELSVLFVDDQEMRRMNRQYRNIDRTTDVLSFPMLDSETPHEESQMLGDIIISLERTKKQAEERNRSFQRELAFLLIHGFFFFFFYEDEQEEQRLEIFAMQ